MRRLLHLTWFDTLAMRVPLALWGAVLLIEGAVFYFGPIESPVLPEFGRMSAMLGLVVIRMVASVVIIALLIHADPTVGTTAFWRSRPISRLALLASKLISTVLWLVLLPGVVTTAVLLMLGMNFVDAATGGSMTSYEQAVSVSMALALAIVTRNLVQFIVAAAIAMGMLSAFSDALLPALLSTWPSLKTTLIYLPSVKVATLVMVLVGGVAIYQYLTLRIRYSIAMLTCAIFIAAVVPRLGSRYSAPPSWPPAAPTNLVSPTDVVLSVDPGTQSAKKTALVQNTVSTVARSVSFEMVMSGEPEEIYFRMAEITSAVEFEDHSVTRWSGRWPTMWASWMPGQTARATADDQPYRSMRRALGNPEFFIPPSEQRPSSRLVASTIPEAQFVRHLGQPARLDASVIMLAYQHHVTATLPLKAGSRLSIPNKGSVLMESASRTSTGITVVVRETSLERYDDSWYLGGGRMYILRNATRGLALIGQFGGEFQSASYTTYFANTRVVTGLRSVTFPVPDAAAGGPVVDDEWMKGAELARLDTKLLGTVTRPLRIESFVLGGEQKKEEAGSKK